ncbi:MAG: RsmB/NOP family class I SAM-dependent RNA methyltransferase [Bacilli bacterium]|nr:RsmB/NOP family class I SAM-dependent RNA methyltransferase [Bacilli bacterium]
MEIPKILQEMIEKEYKNLTNDIINGYKKIRKTTLRVNTIKSNIEEIKKELDKNNIIYEEVSWYKDALIISSDFNIRNLDIYKDGKIYIQSLSSMIPPLILEPQKDEKILDMAASPGGKTTEMYNLSKGKCLITAVEKNKIRAEKLKYNLNLQGCHNASILIEDARNLDDLFSFDKILLDAPCSGSGTLNLKYFDKELVKRSVKTQSELLNKALNILKKDHIMIYSTCSILKEENENQLLKLIKQGKIEIVSIDDDLFKEIPLLPVTIPGTICVKPSLNYEGFFIAKIRKI